MDLSDSLDKDHKQRLGKPAGLIGGEFISRDQGQSALDAERLPTGGSGRFAKASTRVPRHIPQHLASKSGF